jgi:hypothetical protein
MINSSFTLLWHISAKWEGVKQTFSNSAVASGAYLALNGGFILAG